MKEISIFPWKNPKYNNSLAETRQNKRAKHIQIILIYYFIKRKIFIFFNKKPFIIIYKLLVRLLKKSLTIISLL